MVLFYFIIAGIMMFANIFVYYLFFADDYHYLHDGVPEILLLGVLSLMFACLWPIELLLISLVFVAIWAINIRKQSEEKHRREEKELREKEREKQEKEIKESLEFREKEINKSLKDLDDLDY